MPFTQAGRIIRIDTPLGEDVLLLQGFTGQEGISRLFSFDLDLLSEVNPAIAPADILGQRVTITIKLPGGKERYLNGFIAAFEQTGRDPRFTYYRARMVPWLWFLGRTAGCRMFQNKTISEIIIQVFSDCGFSDFAGVLEGGDVLREYCVQYRETALDFVSRLMEQYGLFYFLRHSREMHTLVIADSTSSYQDCPKQERVRFTQVTGTLEDEDSISEWGVRYDLRPGKYSLTDYNFETPTASLEASLPSTINVGGNERLEIYDYPGEYLTRDAGEALTRIRMEEEEAAYTVARGVSNCRAFISGYKFTLTDHYREDFNQAWTLLGIQHAATVGGSYHGDAGAPENYSNTFTAIPATVPFRPPRVTPRPVVQGPQTAVVVGKSGEEIWVDQYGRVKVQFHWDRESQANETSSCWIRVSQLWAGKNWGAMWIPRIGQEVIVDFLEGDPDQPIITGRVYNAVEMPPYALPGEHTKSTIKSYSSKGGGGFNEIRFEDKKGSEQVFIHGEKDLDVRIQSDRREWIGHDRHLVVQRDKREQIERDDHVLVKRDQIEEIDRDHHLLVKGKQAVQIDGSHSFKVGKDVAEEFGASHSQQVKSDLYIKGGKNVVIEAGAGLTIKVGSNFITINPSGVQIKGAMVSINSGGSALSGSAGSLVPPQAPKAAEIADNADPGSDAPSYRKQRAEMQPAQRAAEEAPSHDPNSEESRHRRSWIDIELADETGQPVPGEAYRVTLPDGSTLAEGTLDERGRARIEGIDPGSCQVTFPRLDQTAWRRR